MPHQDKDAPFGTIEEGGAFAKKGRGRPRKVPKLPMSSILRILVGIEQQAVQGRSPDASYSRKILADYACINLERALCADDEEIPLKVRADMALRIGPIVAMLETLIPKDTGKGMPHTESAVDEEIKRRLGGLNNLLKKGLEVPVEQVLNTLAPQAKTPPESA